MKQSTVEEHFFSDIGDENEKSRRIFMKNRSYDAEVDTLTMTEKHMDHHPYNDQSSPQSFLKFAKSNVGDDEEKLPIPKPRERRMRGLPTTEKEMRSSFPDESPKPKPRYNLRKKESDPPCDNELENQNNNLFNSSHSTSCSKHSSVVPQKACSRTPCSECPRSTGYRSKAVPLNVSKTASSVPDACCAECIEAKVKSPTGGDRTGSFVTGGITGKKSPISWEQIQDNDNATDEPDINKLEHLQEEANVDLWQPSVFKSNLDQCVSSCGITETLTENSLKMKEKYQPKIKWIGTKSNITETVGKSKSSRLLNSPVQNLERSTVTKSPQSKSAEPRYLGALKVLDVKTCTNESSHLEDADTIRASIYQVWLERKRQIIHQDKNHQKLKAQQENEKKEQKIIETKMEAKVSFEAWNMKKKSAFKETSHRKKEEEKIKQQAEVEKRERKEEAKKVFEKWKEKKDRSQKETLEKQKQIKKEKKEREEDQVNERKKENVSAFMQWHRKKKRKKGKRKSSAHYTGIHHLPGVPLIKQFHLENDHCITVVNKHCNAS
ncbi:microtubule-associated protein 9 isoform X2 [Narcine bancroftii]|uniref:microtubule-associated protein 9 isoform X2 n=1 Tax=Narcine bancroftii TaxID=1343680 RepID=UPI0038318D59